MTKVAIVTAASKGMGKACAMKLADAGYKLVIMSRSKEIFEVADLLNARPLQGSVNNLEDIERVIGLAYEKYGRIDVVVNNTGHPPKGPLLDLTDKDWRDGMELVLMNVIRFSKGVAQIMKKTGGSIVNLSTFSAKEPSLDFPVSSVMRSALSAYTKLFSREFGGNNIRMNNILPGYIDSYKADEETINQIPLLRQGTPEEVAELALFLASEKSSYITGQDFLIDGGLTQSI